MTRKFLTIQMHRESEADPMNRKVFINDYSIEAYNVQINDVDRMKLKFNFTVTHENYHDVTTLLYENDFKVQIPDMNLTFRATISKYSTSITNLYEVGSAGEFTLELLEKDRS